MTGSISFGFGGSDLILISTFDSLIDSNFFCLGSNASKLEGRLDDRDDED